MANVQLTKIAEALDINKDGDVNSDDIIAAFKGSVRNAIIGSFVAGVVVTLAVVTVIK